MKLRYTAALLAGALITTVSCKKDDDNNSSGSVDVHASYKKEVIANYSNIVFASYEDALTKAKELQTAVDALVASPSKVTHDAAKKAWLDSREPYGQTEAYRFAGGPIDAENGPEGLLNAWPLDEAHIDYVENGTGSDEGNTADIINDKAKFTSITEQLLLDQNENPGEKNIATGYHAIEFLLWGQDMNKGGDFSSAGNRSYTDYLTDGSGTNDNQDRRGTYIKTANSLLIKHLESMVDAWKPNANNYRKELEALPVNEALKGILSGIGILSKSELATERMYVALKNSSPSTSGQEDEHSCFADNTHRDIYTNAQGIQNVYLGTYKRTDGSVITGSSISGLVAKIKPALDTEIKGLLAKSLSQALAIPVPFDEALTKEVAGGNGPIMTNVLTLQTQGDKIAEAARAIGFTISTDIPE